MRLHLTYRVARIVALVAGLLTLVLLPSPGRPIPAPLASPAASDDAPDRTYAAMIPVPATRQLPLYRAPGSAVTPSESLSARLAVAESGAITAAATTSPDGEADRAACQVISAKKISDGGDQSWLASSDLIAFDQPDKNGIYQLYTIRPDGSDRTCLSCTARPGAPSINRHKFNPTWDPSGQWIIAQVEMANNPIGWMNRIPLVSELLLNGVWNDLYAISPDGAKWFKLTSTQASITDGVLLPRFSRDGKQLLWSRLIESASNAHPWGVWRIQLADFVVRDGVPSLANVKDITPPGGFFFEANGFSPDGTQVLFTGDLLSTGQWDPDIWVMSLETQVPVVLTHNAYWNEHASFSPSGAKIEYMSSEPHADTALKTELMLTNPDGSGTFQLTHFNTPGYPEYDPDQSMPITSAWNADGTQLAVTQQMAHTYPSRRMWVLTFAGNCGG